MVNLTQVKKDPRVLEATKLMNNTFEVRYKDGRVAVRHFNTDIITQHPDGSVTVEVVESQTTRKRLGQFKDRIPFETHHDARSKGEEAKDFMGRRFTTHRYAVIGGQKVYFGRFITVKDGKVIAKE